MERFYPLHAWVCESCFLVQLEEFETPEHIFSDDYAYFSSFSDSWLAHSKAYVEMMTERFGLGKQSFVVEIASNDGYLLQYFVQQGVPVLGIEPAANVRRGGREEGRALAGQVLRHAYGGRACRAGPQGRPDCSATTCSRTCRT